MNTREKIIALHAPGELRFGFGHSWKAPAPLSTNNVISGTSHIARGRNSIG